jgi:hypothetical protein
MLVYFVASRMLQNADLISLDSDTSGSPFQSTVINPVVPVPTSVWSGLQERTPHPYSTPLPPETTTPIDGVFSKLDESWPQWWSCRRCADYRPAGGIWKLRFDRGVMRIMYDVTSWVSLASYTVKENKLLLFNDPFCPEAVGEYNWLLEDQWGITNRHLVLQVINDSCSFGLRGENLSKQAWESCSPPYEMTAASDHLTKSPGCEKPNLNPVEVAEILDPSLIFVVHEGYAKNFDVQPDVYVDANPGQTVPLDGIEIRHDESSIPYGLNRVLWGKRSGVEVSTHLPFKAMGVQVLGDHTIGWASVIFDGQELWRGNTREIWSDKGRFGAYFEVSGFEPGLHTLRIESIGADYHPVTVAFFGFNEKQGVVIGD